MIFELAPKENIVVNNEDNRVSCLGTIGLGWAGQSPINLTQDYREFWFEFGNFRWGFMLINVFPSGLALNNLKLDKT